jgi:hypothetical protein
MQQYVLTVTKEIMQEISENKPFSLTFGMNTKTNIPGYQEWQENQRHLPVLNGFFLIVVNFSHLQDQS